MQKLLIVLLCLMILACLVACGNTPQQPYDKNPPVDGPGGEKPEEKPANSNQNVIVVYFSCTNNTKAVAEKVAESCGGEIFRIQPKEPYTTADLNYSDSSCRANREQNDPTCRPQIANDLENLPQDVVFLGYPIWWGTVPQIIRTFVEAHDFDGKTVIPFCTSGGSSVSQSVSDLRKALPNANVLDGRRFGSNASETEVLQWVRENLPQKELSMKIYVGEKFLEVVLENNSSAAALVEKLKQGDVTVSVSDYGDFEKVGKLGFSLPRNDVEITTKPGDVILYLGNNITFYYDENTWDFTLLGAIPNATRQSMLEFFGPGTVTVRLSLK